MIVWAHMHVCISSWEAETFSPAFRHFMCLMLVVASVCYMYVLRKPLSVIQCYFITYDFSVLTSLLFVLCCDNWTVCDDRCWLWLTCLIWWISPLDCTTQSCGNGIMIGRLTDIRIVAFSPSVWCEHIPDLGDRSPWLCRPSWLWTWAEAIFSFDPLHLHLSERRRTWWM